MAAAVAQMPQTPTHERAPESSMLDLPTKQEADVKMEFPDEKTIAKCAILPVIGADGKSRAFGELFAAPGRHLIIFVRHFFCGMCQDYLRSIMASFGPSEVSALSTPTTMTIIGCGQPELIATYAKQTGCKFPIYADPTRQLYETLGLTSSLTMGVKRPEYQSTSTGGVVAKSLVQALQSGSGMLKGGNMSQLGGEFMFEGGQVTFCHRMQNTRNHVEVGDLRDLLGLDSKPMQT